jgi:putative FmdB family regulatory protein
MALYDFACAACGEEFEVFSTGFIKDDQKACPACGSEDVQQKFASFLRSSSAGGGGCAAPASSGFG